MSSKKRYNAAVDFLSSISLDGSPANNTQHNASKLKGKSFDISTDICRVTSRHELLRSTSEGYPRRRIKPTTLQPRVSKISESSICRVKLENQIDLISADSISELFNIINEPGSDRNSTKKLRQTNSRRKGHLISISSSNDDQESIDDISPNRFSRQYSCHDPKANIFNLRCKSERIVLLSSNKVPMVVYSFVPFRKKLLNTGVHLDCHLDSIKESTQLGYDMLAAFSSIPDNESISYHNMMCPSKTIYKSTIKTSDGHIADGETGLIIYNSELLDDPELHSGKHRTLMTFTSYMTSIIDYVNPNDLKRDVNDKFRVLFPWIQLSLTKLRSLKFSIHRIACVENFIDIWTVSQSFVYFERLILMNYVTKANRKLVVAACLVLSCKMNDIKTAQIMEMVQNFEEEYKISRKDIFNYEFGCLVGLQFSLYTPDKSIIVHYKKLIGLS